MQMRDECLQNELKDWNCIFFFFLMQNKAEMLREKMSNLKRKKITNNRKTPYIWWCFQLWSVTIKLLYNRMTENRCFL